MITSIPVSDPKKGLAVYDQREKSFGIIASSTEFNRTHSNVMVMYLDPIDIVEDKIVDYEVTVLGSKLYTLNGEIRYTNCKNLQFKRKLSPDEEAMFDMMFNQIFGSDTNTTSFISLSESEEDQYNIEISVSEPEPEQIEYINDVVVDDYNVDNEEDPVLQSALQYCNTILAMVDRCRNINSTLKEPIKLEAEQFLNETERLKLRTAIQMQFNEARNRIYDELSSIMYNERYINDPDFYNKRIPDPESEIKEMFSAESISKSKEEQDIIEYYSTHNIRDTAERFNYSLYSIRKLLSKAGVLRGRRGKHHYNKGGGNLDTCK